MREESSRDGSVWYFRNADGQSIMKAHLWMSSSEGMPDALIFSSLHEDAEDWKRDIRTQAERYRIRKIICVKGEGIDLFG